MANAPFNIGRTTRIVFIWNGTTVDLPTVTQFRSNQQTVQLKSAPLNSKPITYEVPNGWSGSFVMQRDSDTLDALIASNEAAFWSAATINSGTLYQYITETDGTTTTYEFSDVAITLNDAGQWQNDNIVNQTVNFTASQRIAI
ncbi:hypothetical protein J2D73_18500 [Acetobacter sacchari]|uniref:Phage protein n=1 Tax=Acetobacter sacchari TaxID=2661687 RepID=A0ABS3M0U4_9PROT|nr:hypothetical protein [Acetobacter sacchari]MBO1361776.1 hypothetical protein [Acetobacter sacchari]